MGPSSTLTRPLITPGDLLDILAPAPGERIIELGPGTGYYTLPVAARLGPEGTLAIFDVRQSFLDHTVEHAGSGASAATLRAPRGPGGSR